MLVQPEIKSFFSKSFQSLTLRWLSCYCHERWLGGQLVLCLLGISNHDSLPTFSFFDIKLVNATYMSDTPMGNTTVVHFNKAGGDPRIGHIEILI